MKLKNIVLLLIGLFIIEQSLIQFVIAPVAFRQEDKHIDFIHDFAEKHNGINYLGHVTCREQRIYLFYTYNICFWRAINKDENGRDVFNLTVQRPWGYIGIPWNEYEKLLSNKISFYLVNWRGEILRDFRPDEYK